MSFAERQINLIFSDVQGTLELDGLKVSAVVDMPGGTQASASLQLQIWGMTLEQMNRFSSVGSQMIAINKPTVTVLAGDVGGKMSNVFEGTIFRSFMDFSAIPDVALVVSAITGMYQKAVPGAARHFAGAYNAEDIIQGLAKGIGFHFVNEGSAHAVIRDEYLYGSPIQQIEKVAHDACLPIEIAHDTVTIWPNDGYRDNEIIPLSSETGLVGYPSYYEAGFIVKSEFNPQFEYGRRIQLSSVIPKSNGVWPAQSVTHELSTQQEDGPWFTTVRLSPPPYVPNN